MKRNFTEISPPNSHVCDGARLPGGVHLVVPQLGGLARRVEPPSKLGDRRVRLQAVGCE